MSRLESVAKMVRTLAAWFILLALIIGNTLVLRVCRTTTADSSSVSVATDSEQKDCDCPDGFCPHHPHKQQPETKTKNELSVTVSVPVPAVLPAFVPPAPTPSGRLVAVVESAVLDETRLPATPPPRG